MRWLSVSPWFCRRLFLHAQESGTAPVIPVYSFALQSLNAPSGPALTAYVGDVTKSVNRKWSARVREAVSYGKGVVAVRFTVNKNGTLAPDSITTEVSASPLLDQASSAIIASAPPFNTFPKELNQSSIEFRCTFRYGLLPDSLLQSSIRIGPHRQRQSRLFHCGANHGDPARQGS